MDALTRLATTAVADPAVESAAKDVTVRARTALEDALAKTQLRCPDAMSRSGAAAQDFIDS